jgi:hypothetical protein
MRLRSALAAVSVAATMAWSAAAQPAMQLTGVRLDDAFKMPGSDAAGLVFSVMVRTLAKPTTTGDFTLVVYDEQGRPSGEISCYAMRFLDNGDAQPPWIRGKSALAKAGRYELEYVIGPKVKRGALLYGENRPDVARVPIGPFTVPWP